MEVVKQEMAKVNTYNLGIIKLKWTGMGEFNKLTILSNCGKNSL